MPKRPRISTPAFGAWLTSLRGSDRSYEQIAQKLRPHVESVGLTVDRSSIQKLEAGRMPNWPIMFAISKGLKVPMSEVVLQLGRALGYKDGDLRDLPRHSRTGQQTPPNQGASVDPASARRIADLEQRLKDSEALVGEVQNVARRLMQLVLRDEMRDAAAAPSPRGRRPRKAS